MSFSPTDSAIFQGLFSDAELAAEFSDQHFIKRMIQVEIALAWAQGAAGIIPADAARQIEHTLGDAVIDVVLLAESTETAGIPVINLVQQLRKAAGDAGTFVHYGATTQDIMDTALVLQLRQALQILKTRLHEVIRQLVQLTQTHRTTLLTGRTHSQQALPITFGLKTAGWLAPLLRHLDRLAELKPRVLTLQLGGGSGTLAAILPDKIAALRTEMGRRLDLFVPALPWHTARDGLAEVAGWLSMVSGSLAKMGQDVILMAQTEIGELRESADRSRGGSSTMPQKNNPIQSEVIIAAARANATLLSSMHHAMIQEHERATHGWQLEWLTLPQMIAHTVTALNKASFLTKNLVVDGSRMVTNLKASNGLILAEAATFALARHMERPAAKKLVTAAIERVIQENRHLCDVLAATTTVPVDWQALKDEANYLGGTDRFIDNILQHAKQSGLA